MTSERSSWSFLGSCYLFIAGLVVTAGCAGVQTTRPSLLKRDAKATAPDNGFVWGVSGHPGSAIAFWDNNISFEKQLVNAEATLF
jgi:hypothetical protein